MSRQIKFRAWDIDGEQFMYSENRDFCCVVLKNGGVQFYYVDGEEMHEQHHEDAQQFVGKCDVDGREIYEGDIISFDGGKTESRAKMEVRWSKEYLGYRLVAYKESWAYDMGECLSSTLKIIGNIHENPELLQEESK